VGFQEVRKWALELVPELGPSFEEVEKERAQEEDEKQSGGGRTKERNKHSQKPWKSQGLDSRVSQGLWSEPVGPFIFG
jgi:hypothetical protein